MFIFIANQLNLMYTKIQSQNGMFRSKRFLPRKRLCRSCILSETTPHHRYSNISVGIQLKPKAKVVEEPEALDADAHKIQRYVTIHGQFETYQNQTYGPFNTSVNQNLSDWKPYENNLTTNEHGMEEFQIELKDAALKGSEENVHAVDQVLSTF